MLIKRLSCADVEQFSCSIKKMLNDCISGTYSVSDITSIVEEKYASLLENISNNKAYVYGAVEKELCGFLWSYDMHSLSGEALHIAYVSVLEKYRRNGIAKQMLIAAEKEASARNIEYIELVVSNNNVSALDLYVNNGFKIDRLFMQKRIDD